MPTILFFQVYVLLNSYGKYWAKQRCSFEHIYDGKPFLGVCLGLQVLLSSSDEAPGVKRSDIFKGHVQKIPEGRKIPHIVWNQLKQVKNALF